MILFGLEFRFSSLVGTPITHIYPISHYIFLWTLKYLLYYWHYLLPMSNLSSKTSFRILAWVHASRCHPPQPAFHSRNNNNLQFSVVLNVLCMTEVESVPLQTHSSDPICWLSPWMTLPNSAIWSPTIQLPSMYVYVDADSYVQVCSAGPRPTRGSSAVRYMNTEIFTMLTLLAPYQ